MPDARIFIDSTTFLYTIDDTEHGKRSAAQAWLNALAAGGCGVTSLQVLNEVASVITRKTRRFGSADPFFQVDAFASFGSAPLSNSASLSARNVFREHRYSWWDCLLLASALEMQCTHFLSEDMSNGQRIADESTLSLTIIDPFAHSPEHILSR
jgi:predicted nucleic acid-binding protein